MKSSVTSKEVYDFKHSFCNENPLIAGIISEKLKGYFMEPILDVGSGLGDIVHHALSDKEVICIDINPVGPGEYPLASRHTRHQVDFFEYVPDKPIRTVFISHTLQFIDEDIEKLNAKITELNPQRIIMVVNKNDDMMGTIIDWTKRHFAECNPEVRLPGFPREYRLVEHVDFIAEIKCRSFEELAEQVSYLMLVILTPEKKLEMVDFLTNHLSVPGFTFNQTIEIYTKDEQQ